MVAYNLFYRQYVHVTRGVDLEQDGILAGFELKLHIDAAVLTVGTDTADDIILLACLVKSEVELEAVLTFQATVITVIEL
jgi:hypothetical protein